MLSTATKSTTLVSLATFKQWLGIKSSLTKTITSLTSVGTVATAVCALHGYLTNQFVQITGAVQSGYNGFFLITVVDANTFTFTLAASTTSPATGTPTVTLDDGRYAAMMDSASEELENDIGLQFVKRTKTRYFNGNGKATLVLPNSPIVSISAFTQDGSTIDPTTYYTDLDTGIITLLSGRTFTLGVLNLVITYIFGWDVQDGPALPSDIVRAALDLGKAIHDELVSNAIAASSVSVGPMSMIIKPTDYPKSVSRVVNNWSGSSYRA